MSKTRAILAIVPCECECGNKWTEQELITRTDTGYSYSLEIEHYLAILRREILVEGTRLHPSRKTPVCFQCVDAPLSKGGWVDHPSEIDYYDVQTPEMRENRPRRVVARFVNDTDKAALAQKKIDDLIDL